MSGYEIEMSFGDFDGNYQTHGGGFVSADKDPVFGVRPASATVALTGHNKCIDIAEQSVRVVEAVLAENGFQNAGGSAGTDVADKEAKHMSGPEIKKPLGDTIHEYQTHGGDSVYEDKDPVDAASPASAIAALADVF